MAVILFSFARIVMDRKRIVQKSCIGRMLVVWRSFCSRILVGRPSNILDRRPISRQHTDVLSEPKHIEKRINDLAETDDIEQQSDMPHYPSLDVSGNSGKIG